MYKWLIVISGIAVGLIVWRLLQWQERRNQNADNSDNRDDQDDQ